MTTTAKILVVLNLLLAVLFLGFSASSMSARLGMQGRLTGIEKEKKSLDDKVAVERQSADKADKEVKTLTNDLSLKTKSYEELKKQSDNTIDNLTADLTNFRKEADVTTQRLKQMAEEATQRKEEIDQSRKQNQDLVAKNVTAQNELSKARDEIQDHKNQIERLNDKIRVSEEKQRKLMNWLLTNKINVPTGDDIDTGTDTLTPPPAVEGVITEIRDGGKWMEISVGENDGLKPKHQLQLFRTDPAKYVGMVEVFRTWPNKAVVRPIETLQAPPKKGDRVGPSSNMNRG